MLDGGHTLINPLAQSGTQPVASISSGSQSANQLSPVLDELGKLEGVADAVADGVVGGVEGGVAGGVTGGVEGGVAGGAAGGASELCELLS